MHSFNVCVCVCTIYLFPAYCVCLFVCLLFWFSISFRFIILFLFYEHTRTVELFGTLRLAFTLLPQLFLALYRFVAMVLAFAPCPYFLTPRLFF